MKRVCLLKYVNSTQVDGGVRVAVNLANALSNKFEVYFIALITDGDDIVYKMDNRIHYKAINMKGKRMRQIFLPTAKSLRNYLKRNSIEVVFSIGASPNIFMLVSCMGKGIRKIYCEHVNIIKKEYNDRSQRLCQCLGALFSDYVITLTRRDKDEFENKFPVRKSKIRFVYNWIEDEIITSDHDYDTDSKRIITVARFSPVKGLEELINIADKVLKKHPDWHWDIYGTGKPEYVEKIKNQIINFQLEDQLHLMGQVNNIYKCYKKYAFFVLTSKWEGLPMVLLEAKGNKLPLISFDCPTGPSEIIRDSIDGYLIPLGDLNQMGKKIEQLIEKKEIREIFSENSSGNLGHFSKSSIVKQWEDLILAGKKE